VSWRVQPVYAIIHGGCKTRVTPLNGTKLHRLRWHLRPFFLAFAFRFSRFLSLDACSAKRVGTHPTVSTLSHDAKSSAYRNAWPSLASLTRSECPSFLMRALAVRSPAYRARIGQVIDPAALPCPAFVVAADKSVPQSEMVICGRKNNCVMALRLTGNGAACAVWPLNFYFWSSFSPLFTAVKCWNQQSRSILNSIDFVVNRFLQTSLTRYCTYRGRPKAEVFLSAVTESRPKVT